MFRKWMFPFFGMAVIIFVIIIGFVLAAKDTVTVPASFAEARINGAAISNFLNSFFQESSNRLSEIEAKDKAGKYGDALDLTVQEFRKVQEARVKTIELLGELTTMAAAIPNIPVSSAQSIGMQAIATKMSSVDRLLNYHEKTRQLLDVLQNKFLSDSPANFDIETTEIIRAMNDDALAINELNRKYQRLMGEFDEKLR